jgi:PAS domain S-box-containing protein
MFLYEPNQWQRLSIEELLPVANRSAYAAQITACFETPASRLSGPGNGLTALRGDGTEFPVEIGLSLLTTSEGAWAVACITDLTEWTRLTRTFQDQLDCLQAFREAASEGLITVDRVGTIGTVNQATERIFGYNRSELIGQPLEILIPEAHRGLHAKNRERYFAEPVMRPMGMGLNLSGRRRDGTIFPLEVGLNIARIDGRTAVIAFVTDTTERKRLEEQSAVLGTLVDLQQELLSSRTKEAGSENIDPLTCLDTRAMFEQAIDAADSDVKDRYVVVYSIQRLEQMSARFGNRIADRITVFVSQFIANTLLGEGDRLFRWSGPTFVAVVKRNYSLLRVQRETTEACGKGFEYVVDHAGGANSLLMIALQVRVLALTQVPRTDVVSEIERVSYSGTPR